MHNILKILFGIAVGATIVFGVYERKMDALIQMKPTVHFVEQYIVCVPTDFYQIPGGNQISIKCKRGYEFEEVRESIKAFDAGTGYQMDLEEAAGSFTK